MIQKLKTVSKLIAFIFLITLCSCEKDDETNQLNEMEIGKYRVKEYNFKQANESPKFKKAYHLVADKLNESKTHHKSNTPEIDNDFVIDSTKIKEITVGSITTYTMLINRAISNDESFENLIVQVDSQDSTRAFITKYYPSRNIEYYEEHNSPIFQGTSETREIAYDSSIFMSLVDSGECSMKLVCNWGGSEHVASDICCQTYWVIDCAGGGGTGPSGPSGGTDDDGVGGTGTGTGPGGVGGGPGSSSGTTSGTTTGGTNTNGDPIGVPTAIIAPTNINLTWALSLNSTQSAWINHASRAALKLRLQQYLSVNRFSAESKDFARQLISFAISRGSDMRFDNSVNTTNAISFDSTTEFQEYLNSLFDNLSEELSSATIGDNKTAKFKYRLNFLINFHLAVNQTLNPYNVNGVSSSMSGIVPSMSYSQLTDSNLAEITTNGNVVTVTFSGNLNINVIFEGIGTIQTYHLTFILKIDKITGNPISGQVIKQP